MDKINTIAVCIPSFNPVQEWLQALLDTCGGVDEIIIGDDGSAIPIIASDYKFPKSATVKIFREEKNGGCFHTINRIVKECSCDFISAQADDDYFNNFRFKDILNRLHKSSADIFYFPCRYFGKYNNVFGDSSNLNFKNNYIANNVYGASFFRKSAWEFLEGFQIEVAGDWDFWNRALKSGLKFEYYPHIGAMFRVTDRSMFEGYLAKYGREKINIGVWDNVDKWSKVRC